MSQKEVLRRYGIRPVKRRGQNFLVDGNIARWLAKSVQSLGNAVFELGAGGGALTAPLLAAGAQVTAVEVDRKLCHLLAQEFGANPRFRLLEVDLAQLAWSEELATVGSQPVVAGNLPYLMTSTVLFALAECRTQIGGAVLMIQQEVADRLTAEPGSRQFGTLAALLGSIFAIEVLRRVPATVFWPRPEVTSAVVKLLPTTPLSQSEFAFLRQTVKGLFAQRRKKVGTVLRNRFGLTPDQIAKIVNLTGIDLNRRPEQLSRQALRSLAAALAEGERG
jgi:16S rRNA (adenine1518-N6/adenine1519-N6)-dimethyltransferase